MSTSPPSFISPLSDDTLGPLPKQFYDVNDTAGGGDSEVVQVSLWDASQMAIEAFRSVAGGCSEGQHTTTAGDGCLVLSIVQKRYVCLQKQCRHARGVCLQHERHARLALPHRERAGDHQCVPCGG